MNEAPGHHLPADSGRKVLPAVRQGFLAEPQREGQGRAQHDPVGRPHGIRKQEGAGDQLGLNGSVPATCFPTAATIANSWDPALGEEIGRYLGEEAASQDVCVLLGPGMNIKRSPLCGRNFEYFCEDPYLAGKMAAGYVRGIQKNGVSACPKHFAANNTDLQTNPMWISSNSRTRCGVF